MNLRERINEAREFIANGGRPNSVLATNGKTGFSVFDNFPMLTCYGICPVRSKCYDVATLKRYPNVETARLQRHFFLLTKPKEYVAQLVAEIERKRQRPKRLRIYSGGDFTPMQLPALLAMLRALPDITFYMISKTIRGFPQHAETLLAEPNFFLNLSEMAEYQFGPEWDKLREHPRVNSVYTLLKDEDEFGMARRADIVFNVSKRKADIEQYKVEGLPLCPCDAKDIPSKGACAACGLCSTKGGVRTNLTNAEVVV